MQEHAKLSGLVEVIDLLGVMVAKSLVRDPSMTGFSPQVAAPATYNVGVQRHTCTCV